MGDSELDRMAREVIDVNAFLVLGTSEPDGTPRLSPVFYGVHGYRDFYWVSHPGAHHSVNLAARPLVSWVVFDSSVTVRETRAVYCSGTAREVPTDELADHVELAFREVRGARAFTVEELSGDDLRLYVARADSCAVHVAGSHPAHGTGTDRRVAVRP
jgi:nitroimidazol reductase NimA-like FMN-containing flavoprotein (pyridoxamine 5'-phosphate oxidase superfamily)